MVNIEEWKVVIGYEGYLMVSSIGRVKSINVAGRVNEKIRKLTEDNDGYLTVGSRRSGYIVKTFRVHRLVADAFILNPYNKKTVNHRNGKRADNRAENLEWATQKENIVHSYLVLNRTPPMLGKKHTQESKDMCRKSMIEFFRD